MGTATATILTSLTFIETRAAPARAAAALVASVAGAEAAWRCGGSLAKRLGKEMHVAAKGQKKNRNRLPTKKEVFSSKDETALTLTFVSISG
jgi:hypothetical protein